MIKIFISPIFHSPLFGRLFSPLFGHPQFEKEVGYGLRFLLNPNLPSINPTRALSYNFPPQTNPVRDEYVGEFQVSSAFILSQASQPKALKREGRKIGLSSEIGMDSEQQSYRSPSYPRTILCHIEAPLQLSLLIEANHNSQNCCYL